MDVLWKINMSEIIYPKQEGKPDRTKNSTQSESPSVSHFI